MAEQDSTWEKNTISKMLEMTVREQRAKRRWSIFFKSLVFLYIFFITYIVIAGKKEMSIPVAEEFTAMVVLNGPITPDSDASADSVVPLLRKAFAHHNSKGVILRVNSPGGSPVQSNQIYKEIKHLREQYPDKKLYAVIEDVGASGAYWIACAADAIYADKSSIVGSIGAAISSFGFVDAMEKLGVSRRLYTSGTNKGLLDPFSPETPEQIAIVKQEIKIMGDMFADLVRTSRGDRLRETSDMFSGRFWIGIEAVDLGLIDGFGDANSVATEIVGSSKLVEYAPKKNLLGQLSKSFGQKLGLSSPLTYGLDAAMITDL